MTPRYDEASPGSSFSDISLLVVFFSIWLPAGHRPRRTTRYADLIQDLDKQVDECFRIFIALSLGTQLSTSKILVTKPSACDPTREVGAQTVGASLVPERGKFFVSWNGSVAPAGPHCLNGIAGWGKSAINHELAPTLPPSDDHMATSSPSTTTRRR
ncbi:hypothetical protein EDB92DRAFT_2113154 [Lactarius akahatsu]|uniref:Uncharacterized protein n=1 Tax=Lactarius akahatsu TaxID=416441 RepID=A0AAD4LK91_9AGAM|nr:hypothetical protein EDB92DRAFT_2113154 [Lactarius akahatsu]